MPDAKLDAAFEPVVAAMAGANVPVRTFSDSTRTPTSIDVRQAALTVAFTLTSWPT